MWATLGPNFTPLPPPQNVTLVSLILTRECKVPKQLIRKNCSASWLQGYFRTDLCYLHVDIQNFFYAFPIKLLRDRNTTFEWVNSDLAGKAWLRMESASC